MGVVGSQGGVGDRGRVVKHYYILKCAGSICSKEMTFQAK